MLMVQVWGFTRLCMLRFRVYNLGLLFSVKDLGGYVCTLGFMVYGLGGVFL